MATSFASAREILTRAIEERAFPAASVEIGRRHGPIWSEALGKLTYEADAPPCELSTTFDLSSLTKVLVTTLLTVLACEQGHLSLSDRVGRYLSGWNQDDRRDVTIRDLLEHCAGLSTWEPLYWWHKGRPTFEADIDALPLSYTPRRQSIYSDLGFMVLGFILEDLAGASLSEIFAQRVVASLDTSDLMFNPVTDDSTSIAPTEVDSWRGRLLIGEVQDENAWALGGVAGHAGLFGTARGVGRLASLWLSGGSVAGRDFLSPDLVRQFVKRSSVPGSSRALGWDTMLPTSSCGTKLSASAFGHTGFTGTSLWIDPEQDLYVVLLTNRVHPSRANEAIKAVRPAFHDAVVREIEMGP